MNVSKLNLIVTGFILLQLVVACSQTNNTNTKTEEKPTTATIEQQQPSQAATAVPDSTYTDEDGNDVAKFSDYNDAADHSIKDMPRTTLTVVGGNEYDFGKHKAVKN